MKKISLLLFIIAFNCSSLFAESELNFLFKSVGTSSKLFVKGIKVFYQATKPSFNSYSRLACEEFGMGGWRFRKTSKVAYIKSEAFKIPNEMGECNYQITEMLLFLNTENGDSKNPIKVSLYPAYDTPQNLDLICSPNISNRFECLDIEGNDSLNIPINKKIVNITISVSKA